MCLIRDGLSRYGPDYIIRLSAMSNLGSLVLAVDTTSRHGSVALARDGAVLASLGVVAEPQRATVLWTDIEMLLERVGANIGDVDAFAVARGPGAFTGLRVGIVAAAGLARATGKPLYGATTLELTAREAGAGDAVWAVLNAYRNEVYAQPFRVESSGTVVPLADACVIAPGDVFARIGSGVARIAGTGAHTFRAELELAAGHAGVALSAPALFPSELAGWTVSPVVEFLAPALARYASIALAAGVDPGRVVPCYVRRSEAEINLELGKLQPAGATRVG